MMNLISDLTARDLGGYHAVLAVHAEGSLEAEKLQMLRSYTANHAPGRHRLRPEARRPRLTAVLAPDLLAGHRIRGQNG